MVRLALFGHGRWGSVIARALSGLGDAQLVSVADADPLARAAARTHGATVVSSVAEALALGVDAAVVATPAPVHAEHALEALSAGCAVLVEKPFARTLAEAERVALASRRTGRPVAVGHLLAFHPAVERLERWLHGAGPVSSFTAVRRGCRAGTVEAAWWQLAPHDLALALRLAGVTELTRVERRAERVEASLSGAGVRATVTVAPVGPTLRRLQLVAGAGAVVFDDARDEAALYWLRRPLTGVELARAEPAFLSTAALSTERFQQPRPLERQLRQFLDVVAGAPPRVSVDEGVRVQRWLDELPSERSLAADASAALALPS